MNVESGHVYLHYTSTMENDEGELLVLDHDIINDYYEYALKKRILENMLYKGEDVGNLLKYTIEQLRKAKIEALSTVSMPDYNRLVDMYHNERVKMLNKYYKPFL